MRAIESSDANLGNILAALGRRGLRGSTDVFVVSDHGFSTIAGKIDVAADLSAAGFRAARTAPGGLRPREVMVVGQGGSCLLYVGGHDPQTIQRLAAFLEIQNWSGVVFSRSRVEGTFPMAEAHIDSPEAPDLLVSLRWSRDKSATGAPGMLDSDNSGENVGAHASLSPYDMHNMLVAAGPDIRPGVTDTLPSGNVDLAPTILWLLGAKEKTGRMDGRVLSEALRIEAPALKSYEIKRLIAGHRMADGRWDQYLQVSELNGVRYLDEGNGAFVPERRAP
jgi:arylsulfatase A-like enzyme